MIGEVVLCRAAGSIRSETSRQPLDRSIVEALPLVQGHHLRTCAWAGVCAGVCADVCRRVHMCICACVHMHLTLLNVWKTSEAGWWMVHRMLHPRVEPSSTSFRHTDCAAKESRPEVGSSRKMSSGFITCVHGMGMRACGNAGMREWGNGGMGACGHAGMRACGHAGMWVWAWACGYAGRRIMVMRMASLRPQCRWPTMAVRFFSDAYTCACTCTCTYACAWLHHQLNADGRPLLLAT